MSKFVRAERAEQNVASKQEDLFDDNILSGSIKAYANFVALVDDTDTLYPTLEGTHSKYEAGTSGYSSDPHNTTMNDPEVIGKDSDASHGCCVIS